MATTRSRGASGDPTSSRMSPPRSRGVGAGALLCGLLCCGALPPSSAKIPRGRSGRGRRAFKPAATSSRSVTCALSSVFLDAPRSLRPPFGTHRATAVRHPLPPRRWTPIDSSSCTHIGAAPAPPSAVLLASDDVQSYARPPAALVPRAGRVASSASSIAARRLSRHAPLRSHRPRRVLTALWPLVAYHLPRHARAVGLPVRRAPARVRRSRARDLPPHATALAVRAPRDARPRSALSPVAPAVAVEGDSTVRPPRSEAYAQTMVGPVLECVLGRVGPRRDAGREACG